MESNFGPARSVSFLNGLMEIQVMRKILVLNVENRVILQITVQSKSLFYRN